MKTVTAHLKNFVGTYARAAVLGTVALATGFIAPAAAHAQNYPQGYPQSNDQSYPQGSGQGYGQGNDQGYAPGNDQGYTQQGYAQVNSAPPALPTYDQPPCPGDGYIWTPGYWAYGPQGYFWVDGAWVEAPYEGALWTPGYWGYDNGAYDWNAGYWGNTVGYYGGIDYGFGYFGTGFYGGYWNGGRFFYNSAYNRLGGRGFRNVYDDRSHGNVGGFRGGSRSFDPHPQTDGRRGSSFGNNTNGFNRGGNNQGNRANFDQQNRGNQQDRGNFNRPVYQGANNQQRNFAAPQTQPAQNLNRQAYNGGDQNQGRSFQQAPAQQHFSQPAQQARPAQAPQQQQQHFSAPSGGGFQGGGGGGFHGGGAGGGGFHGGGGGRR